MGDGWGLEDIDGWIHVEISGRTLRSGDIGANLGGTNAADVW